MTNIVLLVVAAALVLFLVTRYNLLVRLRNAYENAFTQIDVQLKRRHDLIPNLVETAKGYMQHERETLEAVIQARNAAVSAEQTAADSPRDASAIRELAGAEQALTGALGKFFALSEAYPDLKANENMQSLMEELTSTENRIAFSRQAYNDAVMRYENAREAFPTNVVSGIFGFGEAAYFVIEDDAEREVPQVSFGG